MPKDVRHVHESTRKSDEDIMNSIQFYSSIDWKNVAPKSFKIKGSHGKCECKKMLTYFNPIQNHVSIMIVKLSVSMITIVAKPLVTK